MYMTLICPAYAGMILLSETLTALVIYLSRVCGDDPIDINTILASLCICPAYAGMILEEKAERRGKRDLSRVCGDDPFLAIVFHSVAKFVPRMRG